METALYRRWLAAHEDAAQRLAGWNPAEEPVPEGLVDAVGFHRAVEERLFFPRLARYFVGGGPIPLMTAAHRDLAEGPREDAAAWRDAFLLHLRQEDLVLLPIARLRFTSREWAALDEQAQALWPPGAYGKRRVTPRHAAIDCETPAAGPSPGGA